MCGEDDDIPGAAMTPEQHKKYAEVFHSVGLLIAGEDARVALAALEEYVCAALCGLAKDKVDALRMWREIDDRSAFLISRNFAYYKTNSRSVDQPGAMS